MIESHMKPTPNPDELEVAPGAEREVLEGWVPALATEEQTREVLEQAFDYRGDVTITLKTGVRMEGYIYDRQSSPYLHKSIVRLMPKDTGEKISIPYSEIAGVAFTGRDTAAGKSWEAWMKKYWEKKAAGEKNIGIQAEALD
jgi:hypothetical protein